MQFWPVFNLSFSHVHLTSDENKTILYCPIRGLLRVKPLAHRHFSLGRRRARLMFYLRFFNRAAEGVRGSSFTRVFFNRAAVGVRGSSFARGFFFFSFVGDLA